MRRLNTIKGIKEWWGWNVDIEIDFTKPWSIEAFQSAWWFISWWDQWIEYPLKITDEWITIDYAWVLSDDASISFSIWLSWVSEVEVQFDPAVTWHKFNSINITLNSSCKTPRPQRFGSGQVASGGSKNQPSGGGRATFLLLENIYNWCSCYSNTAYNYYKIHFKKESEK